MRPRFVAILLGLSTFGLLARAGEDEKKFQSGPQPGKVLPGPFDSRVVNGEFKGNQHCIICQHRLFPVVLAFIKEPTPEREWKEDGPLAYLLDKLEEAVARHDLVYLKSGAVFLSPHAHSSATAEGKKEAKELVEEARNREALLRRLEKRGAKYKNVTVAVFPAEGPKGYQINPDAEVTLIYFEDLKIRMNEAFPAGEMSNDDVDRIMKKLDETIRGGKAKKASAKS